MNKKQLNIIDSLIEVLKRTYGNDTSGHDWFHLERVWKMAKRLAKHYRVNQFVLEMAAITHDVDDYKFKKEGEEEHSATKAILGQHAISQKDHDHILDIVGNVSFKGAHVPTPQKTIEGKIVQDADRLEAMGALGIARVFTYNGFKGNMMYDPGLKPKLHRNYQEYRNPGAGTAINHFYEKLLLLKDRLNTPEAKKIGERRHKFLETYLKEFFAEVNGEV